LVTYSICITHYNNNQTIRQSLETILNQVDELFEVVVVDNFSNDGSEKILKEYADAGKILLFQEKCSRGRGRQLAFEKSKGGHILSNFELDNIYKPTVKHLIEAYHSHCEGNLLLALSKTAKNRWGNNGVTMSTRNLIERLGGWRDLQIYEDSDQYEHAASIGAFRWGWFDILEHSDDQSEWGQLRKARYRYQTYRDGFRLGRKVNLTSGSIPTVALKFTAKITSSLQQPLRSASRGHFDSMAERLRIDLD
jgi:glycosyltransferase involved in cell wall biosynthesis